MSLTNIFSQLVAIFWFSWLWLLRPHESQHARPPCPSPTHRVHSNTCPSSRWCHPAILSSVVPFSSCPQSLPASKSFPMSQLFTWGGQSTGVPASVSFLPKKSQGWSPSEWTGWISFQSKGLSRIFSSTTVQRHQFTWNRVAASQISAGWIKSPLPPPGAPGLGWEGAGPPSPQPVRSPGWYWPGLSSSLTRKGCPYTEKVWPLTRTSWLLAPSVPLVSWIGLWELWLLFLVWSYRSFI